MKLMKILLALFDSGIALFDVADQLKNIKPEQFTKRKREKMREYLFTIAEGTAAVWDELERIENDEGNI